jgi:electron transfer flavoprotein beta subunit
MKLIVCVKQVVDPEEPPSSFGVDETTNLIKLPPGVPNVINPFDKNATEAALRLKDLFGGSVSILSLGTNIEPAVLREPIAMGADELIFVEDESFAQNDVWLTAFTLAKAIKKAGDFDLIFCGRQDSETDAGQVGSILAKILDLPCVTVAKNIELSEGKAVIERVTDDGHEVISTSIPAVITISNELGEPRYPTVKQTMRARKVKPTIWKGEDLDLPAEILGAPDQKIKLVKLFKPVLDVECQMIQGNTPEEMGANLATVLRESNLI